MGTSTDKSKNGYTEKDNRGKTGSRIYPKVVLKTVKNHIKKFPMRESHYMPEKSKRQFSASNLNIHSCVNIINLKRKSKLGCESKLTGISSMPVLI